MSDSDDSDQNEINKTSLTTPLNFVPCNQSTYEPERSIEQCNPTKLSESAIGHWEAYTKGIGAKLLLQMGYKPGKGLGRSLQGIVTPVEAHIRKGRGAIGAYGPETKSKQFIISKGLNDNTDKKKVNLWKKEFSNTSNGEVNYRKFVTSSTFNTSVFIDMTGPDTKIISNFDAVPIALESYKFSTKELIYNIYIIKEVTNKSRQLHKKISQEKIIESNIIRQKMKNISLAYELETKYCNEIKNIINNVSYLRFSSNNVSDMTSLCAQLIDVGQTDFLSFHLQDLVVNIGGPIMKLQLKTWKPLDNPTIPISLMLTWKQILCDSEINENSILNPYCALCWSIILPFLREAITNDWDPHYPNTVINLLQVWRFILPAFCVEHLLNQNILPKLLRAVCIWNPLIDVVPIHEWVLPWKDLLCLNSIYYEIRTKLSEALIVWQPADKSAFAMIQPFRCVFTENEMDSFVRSTIIPKIQQYLSEMPINPTDQNLEYWHNVWLWKDLLSIDIMVSILESSFLQRWTQTLVNWLNLPGVNLDQVTSWYSGWKSLIDKHNIGDHPIVVEHFSRALHLMQRYCGYTDNTMRYNNTHSANLSELNFHGIVSQRCAERGICFSPIAGQYESGHQIYRLGKYNCYIDRGILLIENCNSTEWKPINLNQILNQ